MNQAIVVKEFYPVVIQGGLTVWYLSVVCDLHVYVCLSECVCEN